MKLIGFDIETTGDGEAYGLQPYRVLQGTARITSAAFVDEDGEVLWANLEPKTPRFIEGIRIMLNVLSEEPEAVLVGWNTQFDVAWLIANGLEEEVRSCRWLDGEVLRRALENDTSDKSYGLKATVTKYLPEFAGYEGAVGGNYDEVNDTLLEYNTIDAKLTAKLARMFLTELDQRRQLLSGIICQAIVPVAGAWVEGISLDPDAIDTWEEQASRDRDKHLAEIIELGRLQNETPERVQKMLGSHVQLKKWLQYKGHTVAKTDQSELSKFAHVPLIKSISDYKKANTAVSRFITSIRNSIQYNGTNKAHPSCRLWNTYTGRFGYTSTTTKKKLQTGIATHQFPRKTEARNCIVAPDGYLLVECDFATQESRLICDFSGDEVLYDIFASGKDFHTYMAAIIAEVDYENMIDRIAEKDKEAKNYRQLAKVVNLSCQYRTGWRKLIDVARTQYDVIFDEPTSQRLHKLYRTTYKRVPEYWDTAVHTAMQNGYAETRGGRRVYIDDWSSGNKWAADSTAINFPIQGTAADMKFLAISQVDDLLYENGGKYLLDMHDALFALVPDTSKGMDTAIEMRRVLSTLPYEQYFNWSPRVALPVELKVGKAWGSLREIK